MTFDFGDIAGIAVNEQDRAVYLSGDTIQIAYTAIQFMLERWRWRSYDGDADWNTIEGMTALACEELMGNLLLGTIHWTTGTIPANARLCNGDVLNSDDYTELRDMMDSQFRPDPYHIVLPNIEDRVIVGAGNDYGFGDTGGLDEVELTKDQTGRHKHSFSNYTYGVDIEGVGIPDPTGVGLPKVGGEDTSYTGSGDPHENRPPYVALVAFIFVK